jgi:hypothetical protein
MERCDITVCTEGEQRERCEVTALCVLRENRWSVVMMLLCLY